MFVRRFALALLLGAFVLSGVQSHAAVIGPGDFGPNAQIETFDFGIPGTYTGPLVSNGVTYSFSAPDLYRFIPYNFGNDHCAFPGVCLGNGVSQATWNIALDTPANRVGGYLNGIIGSQTYIYFYDINDMLLDSIFPIVLEPKGYPWFFGFETDAGLIKRIRLEPCCGLASVGLDNFTTEVVPIPAALPLFASGLGVMGLIAWRRKRKAALQAAAC